MGKAIFIIVASLKYIVLYMSPLLLLYAASPRSIFSPGELLAFVLVVAGLSVILSITKLHRLLIIHTMVKNIVLVFVIFFALYSTDGKLHYDINTNGYSVSIAIDLSFYYIISVIFLIMVFILELIRAENK